MEAFTAPKSSSPPHAGAGTPPGDQGLVVRVPWLATAPATKVDASPATQTGVPERPVPDSHYQPQSFVAAMGTSVPSLELSPPLLPGVPSPPLPSLSAIPSAGLFACESDVQQASLNLDAPQASGNDPHPQYLSSDEEAFAWHERLLAADRLLKQYARPLVLTLALIASGLMLLALNTGQPAAKPKQSPLNPSPRTQPLGLQPVERRLDPREGENDSLETPAVGGALGPQGLAMRRGNAPNWRNSQPAITPIEPHFEARPLAKPATPPAGSQRSLPYPSTHLPSWQAEDESETEEDPSNVATLGAVRPTR